MDKGKLYDVFIHKDYQVGISGVVHIISDEKRHFLDEAKKEFCETFDYDEPNEIWKWFSKWFGDSK